MEEGAGEWGVAAVGDLEVAGRGTRCLCGSQEIGLLTLESEPAVPDRPMHLQACVQ